MKKGYFGTVDEEFEAFIRGRSTDSVGKDYFLELVAHPNQPIHCTRLRHLNAPASIHAAEFKVHSSLRPGFMDTDHSIPELPIPFTDRTTLEQAKKQYLLYYTRECQARMDNDYAKADECQEEREKYEDYLKKAVTKRGRIRVLQSQTQTDYRIVRANLLRFIGKVRAQNPRYADYISDHLVIGYHLMWRQ